MFIFGWGRQTIKQIGVVFKNLCSHCHNEEYWTLTKITTVNQLLVDGKITQEEYQLKTGELNGSPSEQVEVKSIERIAMNNKNAITYCSGCGIQVTKEIKFCGNCGVKAK